jgi:hypothetical protein
VGRSIECPSQLGWPTFYPSRGGDGVGQGKGQWAGTVAGVLGAPAGLVDTLSTPGEGEVGRR